MELIKIAGGGYTAVINLSRGANCISLKNEEYGAKLLREPDYGNFDNPYLYGMPILFPVNRISGGCFEFEGREYRFPINEPSTGCHLHGELHATPFEAREVSESRVLCAYRAESGEYLGFPHAFEITIEYSLGEGGMIHVTEVKNLSGENMPCMLGFHTTFNSGFAGGGEVRAFADIAEEYRRNMKNYLPTGEKPSFDDISNLINSGELSPYGRAISRHYRAGRSGLMTLENLERGLKIVYENDEKFAFRLIYNGAGDEYICLEPQNCAANAPNAPFGRVEGGFDFIRPGESKKYISKIYLRRTNDEDHKA